MVLFKATDHAHTCQANVMRTVSSLSISELATLDFFLNFGGNINRLIDLWNVILKEKNSFSEIGDLAVVVDLF